MAETILPSHVVVEKLINATRTKKVVMVAIKDETHLKIMFSANLADREDVEIFSIPIKDTIYLPN